MYNTGKEAFKSEAWHGSVSTANDQGSAKKTRSIPKRIGEYLGISDKAVAKWEAGAAVPSAANLAGLAKIKIDQ